MSISFNSQEYQRFVPQGAASLVDDAPGWSSNSPTATNDDGPICWKCRGSGKKKCKDSNQTTPVIIKQCTVCNGSGRLQVKQKEALGALQPGKITRARKGSNVMVLEPLPVALLQPSNQWIRLVETANRTGVDVLMGESSDDNDNMPSWIPRMGEELCNLVGSWRILQRVGSHRWTTDDLVTAYVASQQQQQLSSPSAVRYLDLGTGNASVLQMTTWALLRNGCSVDATGVEARLEAVELARRSLAFNLGDNSPNARIVHGDFRNAAILQDDDNKFDLITGTPPYFRVDFQITHDNHVESAVINQGGMPTAKQSAPARCEYRGGIEAYVQAASLAVEPTRGTFCVVENWLNHDRLVAAAQLYKMEIQSQLQVSGKVGRDTLFCVYVMKLKQKGDTDTTPFEPKCETLAVRDERGNWTREYRESVLNAMSIPDPTVASLNSES